MFPKREITKDNYKDFFVADPNTGCWIWQGSLKNDGYGRIHQRLAHRLFYEFAKGPIPEGLEIMHMCDNPPCVNPDHLVAGTHHENMLDRNRKGRCYTVHLKGEDNPRALLTENKVKELREIYARGGITRKQLGKLFGVSKATIDRVLARKSWVHVDA